MLGDLGFARFVLDLWSWAPDIGEQDRSRLDASALGDDDPDGLLIGAQLLGCFHIYECRTRQLMWLAVVAMCAARMPSTMSATVWHIRKSLSVNGLSWCAAKYTPRCVSE